MWEFDIEWWNTEPFLSLILKLPLSLILFTSANLFLSISASSVSFYFCILCSLIGIAVAWPVGCDNHTQLLTMICDLLEHHTFSGLPLVSEM